MGANATFINAGALNPGFIVTATDGIIIKTHTVESLALTNIDQTADRIYGTSDPNQEVESEIRGNGDAYRVFDANGSGDWMADFAVAGVDPGQTSTGDIAPGTEGYAAVYDSDRDETRINLEVANVYFTVWRDSNEIHGYNWPVGAMINLSVDDPGTTGLDFTLSQANGNGDWDPSGRSVRFNLNSLFQLQPGFIVTMTDGVNSITHTITNLTFTGVDVDADTVSGTADEGSQVWVESQDDPNVRRWLIVGSGGNWTADFSVPGIGPDYQVVYDIVPGSRFHINQHDPHASTAYSYQVPNPNFSARFPENEVHGYDWPLGTAVTVTIHEDGVLTDYTDTQSPVVAPWDSNTTWTQFQLGSFTLKPGQFITMTNGTFTKTHTVTGLTITKVDPEADTVEGFALEGSRVDVGQLCDSIGLRISHSVR